MRVATKESAKRVLERVRGKRVERLRRKVGSWEISVSEGIGKGREKGGRKKGGERGGGQKGRGRK
jgi:hypothetical protein